MFLILCWRDKDTTLSEWKKRNTIQEFFLPQVVHKQNVNQTYQATRKFGYFCFYIKQKKFWQVKYISSLALSPQTTTSNITSNVAGLKTQKNNVFYEILIDCVSLGRSISPGSSRKHVSVSRKSFKTPNKVNIYISFPLHLQDNPQKSRCLGVFGLNVYTTREQIIKIFERYGTIDRVQVVVDAKVSYFDCFSGCLGRWIWLSIKHIKNRSA